MRSEVQIRPLDEMDALEVVMNARSTDRAEMIAAHGTFRPATVAASFAGAMRASTVTFRRIPAAIVAVWPSPGWPGLCGVGMLATDDWRHVWRATFRHCRDDILPETRARGFRRAEARVMHGNRPAARFLMALGFVREAIMPESGTGADFELWAWTMHHQRGRARDHLRIQRRREPA